MNKIIQIPAKNAREEINAATSDNWEVTYAVISDSTGLIHTSNDETTIVAERQFIGWEITLKKNTANDIQLIAEKLTREEAIERVTEIAHSIDF